MTITRFLPGVVLLVATAGPALAQYGVNPYPAPSQFPGMTTSGTYGGPDPGAYPVQASPGLPSQAPDATALDRVTAPVQPGGGGQAPYAVLTGQPPTPQAVGVGGLPPGSYPSPFFTDGPGCCGPLGRNGRVGYDIYIDTGPSFIIGHALNSGPFDSRLEAGWMVNGGGRSLFFNQSHTAAWAVDLGMSYQYNRGDQIAPYPLNIRQPALNQGTGAPPLPQPDKLTLSYIRDIDRTNFNFGVGRDWWLGGPGATGLMNGWTCRFGAEVGGRWGTAHVDLVPFSDPFGYARRQNVTHGVFAQVHAYAEVPLGTTIFFAGAKLQWGYDWTNLVPPTGGDIMNLNVLLSAGLRF
jgi:hypothetical protein